MSRSNRWWFCGPPADVVADLFSKLGQFDPKKCYYTASISKEELEARSIRVWDTEEQCACVLPPPPPSPPPAGIYFCGKPAVWHFFDYTINPHTCYVSFDISRLEVMSLGVDVYKQADDCRCSAPPSPPPPPTPPLSPSDEASWGASSPWGGSSPWGASSLILEAPPRRQSTGGTRGVDMLWGGLFGCTLLVALLARGRRNSANSAKCARRSSHEPPLLREQQRSDAPAEML